MGYRAGCGPFEHLWISIMPKHFGVNRVVSVNGPAAYRRVWRALLSSDETLVVPGCFIRSDSGTPDRSDLLFAQRFQGGLRVLLAAIVARSRQPPGDRTAPTFQRNAVKAIQQHIDETAGRGVTLDSLARLSGYSKYHFLRLFERHAGVTPQQYIDACRRKHARKLLEEGWSRKALARELGFSHASSFSRWASRHLT
jgi:AraC-like DNA-binding protein